MIRTLAMAAGLALAAGAAQAAFTGVSIVEGNSATASAVLGQNATVLQVYATFDGAGDGATNTVVTTTFVNIMANAGLSFYQDAFGSSTPPNQAFFPLAPTLQFDSYGTIGSFVLGDGGSISTEPGSSESATAYVGGWFTSDPPSAPGAADPQIALGGGFGTLLFQFTMLGTPEGASENIAFSDLISGSFQINEQGQGGPVAHNVTIIPTPGALALFGVAGLAATRRRR